MTIFKNPRPENPPGWNHRIYKKTLRRSGKMDSSLLLEYADMAGTGTAMAFADYRKDGEDKSLDEIEMGLSALWAVVQVLRERKLTGT